MGAASMMEVFAAAPVILNPMVRNPADGVGFEVASRLHSRVLVRSDDGVVTLIVYRL